MTLVGLLLILIVVFAPRGLIEPVLSLASRFRRKGEAA
jgi:branched-chain amino acid transport system permease protein